MPFFKSIKVQKLFSFFILKYFTNFVKLVDFFPAKKGCLKRRSQEKVSGVDHRRGSLLGSLLEVSGEVSRGGLRGRSQGEVSGGGIRGRSLLEVSFGGLRGRSQGEVSGGGLRGRSGGGLRGRTLKTSQGTVVDFIRRGQF